MQSGLAATIRRHRTRVVSVFLVLAVVLTVIAHVSLFHREYDYELGWIDSIFATIARSYASQGFTVLNGVPLQNNPPVGLEPDAYIHWPPLFPMLLGLLFRLFGESEATAHALMLVNLLALVALVALIARELRSTTAAVVAALFTLTMPVTIQYGAQVVAQYAAITLLVASVYFFIRRSYAWAGVATSLAVMMSWEAALASTGLVLAALLADRSRLRAALAMVGVAALTGAAVLAFYITQYPQLASDLWETVVYRAGLGPYRATPRLHTLVNERQFEGTYSGAKRVWQMITPTSLLGQFGQAALFAVPVVAIVSRRMHRDAQAWLAIGGLFAPWLIWYALMPGHIQHPQMMLFAVPAAAVMIGLAIDEITERDAGLLLAAALLIAAPAATFVPLITTAHQRVVYNGWRDEVRFAKAIAQHAPQGCVVLSPEKSGVPVYYSRRHFVRGVSGSTQLAQMLPRARAAFPGVPLYLAVRPPDAGAFSASAASLQLVYRSDVLVLYRIR